MVFVAKKKSGKETYYYLAHNLRSERGKWKSLREYIGKELPADNALQKLIQKFVQKHKIRLRQKYAYIGSERLAKLDYIIGEFQKIVKNYPRIALEKREKDFTVRFTYNTNAIEGNTVSLLETAAMLEKKVVPEGKSLREVHEIFNTERALNFIKKNPKDVSRRLLLRLHKIMMANIDDEQAGKIRNYPVSIKGANWMPPSENEVEAKFGEFLAWYIKSRRNLHPIELAAIAHLKFIEVHPFGDGNGRVARLMTNLVLMRNGYPPINIKVKDTIPYVKELQYAQNTQKFDKLVDWFVQKLGEEYAESAKGK
ncbi:MAG: Fic family protein [Candidatus Micrarchaeia archaeon]